MTNKQSLRIERRKFLHLFYHRNHFLFILAIVAAVLVAAGNLMVSWLLQQIIDLLTGSAMYSLKELVLICIVSLFGFTMALLLDYSTRPLFVKRAVMQYKDYAFEQLTKKSIRSFSNESSATYLSALTNDLNSIEANYLAKIFTFFMQLLLLIGALVLMLLYSPLLTLAAFLFSVVPILSTSLVGNRLSVAEKRVSDQNESFLFLLKDTLAGFSVIKSFKAEAQSIKAFAKSNRETEEKKIHRRKVETMIQLLGAVSGIFAQIGVFLFGAYLALNNRGVTAGIMIVFVELMNFILIPISSFPEFFSNRKAAYTLIEKLSEALSKNISAEGADVEPVLRKEIVLKDVSVSYEGIPVLNKLNVHFKAGKSVAVIGSSGSGKSTLLNLLMGSTKDYEGEIFFDTRELRTINTTSLYDLVSLVQQEVFIFNSSIRNNITMYHEFAEEKISQAICRSGLQSLLSEKGGDYLCGENGNGLSGGEQQRISIARCLLHETPILLVDEATAALDAKTAFEVTSSLLSLEGITRIVVTHRLEETLLRKYDEIIVLKKGSVHEMGSFEKLMNQKGYFYSLFMVSQ